MRRFNVTLSGPPMSFGGLGTAATGYSVGVDADDAKDAVVRARQFIRDNKPEFAEFADGRVKECAEMFRWAVTLRGRDKRRRETFFAIGSDEVEALKYLGRGPAATAVWRFAKFSGPLRAKRRVKRTDPHYVPWQEDERIIKLERRAWS